MVKKVNTNLEEGLLLDYLLRVAKKSVTRLDLKKAGYPDDRKTLRKLEKLGKISKTENFAKNTAKKDSMGNLLQGTKYYTYSIKIAKEDK